MANQSITITLNDRLQAVADELVRILPLIPTSHWGLIADGANPQVLAAVSEQLATSSSGALIRRLAQLKLDGASEQAMRVCTIQWQDAYLLSLQLDYQSRDYIAQRLEQVLCPDTLRFLLHIVNFMSFAKPLIRELALARLGQLAAEAGEPAPQEVPTLPGNGLAVQQTSPLLNA